MIAALLSREHARICLARTHAADWLAYVQRHVIDRELDKRLG